MIFKLTASSEWGATLPQEYTASIEANGFKTFATIGEDKMPEVYVYIDTLEDLMKLKKVVGHQIVISDNEIEVYDDYRE